MSSRAALTFAIPAVPVRAWTASVGRGVLVAIVALAVTVAGMGWLYLLRHSAWLHVGPRVQEALALQRLAGGGAQPLGRLAVAWLPAGLAGGVALRGLGLGRFVRAALLLATCTLLLMALGAAADAVTNSEPLDAHVAAQAGRAATWLAAGLVAIGAALAPGRRR